MKRAPVYAVLLALLSLLAMVTVAHSRAENGDSRWPVGAREQPSDCCTPSEMRVSCDNYTTASIVCNAGGYLGECCSTAWFPFCAEYVRKHLDTCIGVLLACLVVFMYLTWVAIVFGIVIQKSHVKLLCSIIINFNLLNHAFGNNGIGVTFGNIVFWNT